MTYILQISKPGKQRGQGTCPNTQLLSERENRAQSHPAVSTCPHHDLKVLCLLSSGLLPPKLLTFHLPPYCCRNDLSKMQIWCSHFLAANPSTASISYKMKFLETQGCRALRLPLRLSLQLLLPPPNSFYSSISKDLLFSERDIPFHASRWHTYYSLFTEYLSSSIFHIFPIQTAVHSLYSGLNRASPQLRKLVS